MKKKIGWFGVDLGILVTVIGMAAMDSEGTGYVIALSMTLGGMLFAFICKLIFGIDFDEYEVRR